MVIFPKLSGDEDKGEQFEGSREIRISTSKDRFHICLKLMGIEITSKSNVYFSSCFLMNGCRSMSAF